MNGWSPWQKNNKMDRMYHDTGATQLNALQGQLMNHTRLAATLLIFLGTGSAYANTACMADNALTIVSATDDGLYEETHGPENTIDGNFDPDSRWSNQSQGTAKSIVFDLGAEQTIKSFSIAWHKGDSRWSEFSLEASVDGQSYKELIARRKSAGTTLEFETYKLSDTQAQFIKLVSNGNASNDWNSVVEVSASGCGIAVEKPETPVITARKGQGVMGMRKDLSPGENFDLSRWYITTPADDNGDEKADSVYEDDLVAGWTDPRFFYTDPATGGMVFRSTPAGAKTSKNTNYTRTELRGMLRQGNESIETRVEGGFPNKNNWVFSSAPASAQAMAGGVDGVLRATLAVNQVTRLGKAYQVGRVIIGQIHAKDDEPIRLYYRKLPQNKFGSIYYAHEPAVGKEQWIEMIGSRGDRASNPDDGIALDERFSYEIEVKGKDVAGQIHPMLYVKIIRDDGSVVEAEPFDMSKSGFSVENEFMFFKAGAYSQNNSSPEPDTDFDRVIFYDLEAAHNAPPSSGEVMASLPNSAGQQSKTVTKSMPTEAAVPGIVFDDMFADGVRKDGADAHDTNWWTTTNSSAIEVSTGSLGLVSGGSGRGIRTTFAPQHLTEGQTLKATFTFTTPATVGSNRDSALRIALHDKLNRTELEGDLSASSKKPNKSYDGLPGYMIDFDIGMDNADATNIDIRKHTIDTHGRLLGTSKGYKRLGSGGNPYVFEPEQIYSGTMSIKKLSDGLEISASLSQSGNVLSEFTMIDDASDWNNFGMLAFHVNSKTFGSSKQPNTPDNGIDFSQVKVEVLP